MLWLAVLAGCQSPEKGATAVTTETAPEAVCAPVFGGDVVLYDADAVAAQIRQTPSIDGSLAVSGLPTLEALTGLCRVGEDLQISDSLSPDLGGLEDLTLVGGTLELAGMGALERLSGLSGLLGAGRLRMMNTALDALVLPPGLTSLPALELSQNGQMASLEGDIYEIGTVEISRGGALRSIRLPLLRAVGTLSIQEDGLSELSLPELERISDMLSVYSDVPVAIDAPLLAEVGIFRLNAPGSYTFPALQLISGALALGDEEQTLSFPALEQVAAIQIADEDLYAWPSMPALTAIGVFYVEDGEGLGSLSGLASVLSIQEVMIDGSDAVTLDGLSGLEEAGSVAITRNDLLTSVAGLGAISSMDRLYVEGNDQLAALALPGLQTVGDLLILETALTDLDGLSGLTAVTGDLLIRGNPELSQAEIDAFLARVTVSGEVSVEVVE